MSVPTQSDCGMNYSRSRSAVVRIVGLAIVVSLIASWLLVPANAYGRYRVRSILLSDLSVEEQLERLDPYVRLGDSNTAVNRKLSARPEQDVTPKRPTESAYGLDGVNLVLAVKSNGRIIAIGRHKWGTDDGTIWLTEPPSDWD